MKVARFTLVLCTLFICTAAFAQPAPEPLAPVSILATLSVLAPKFVAIGTALSAFLAVVAAQFPQLTWVSKLATILGYLPVIDVHGLTTGKMQERMKSAVDVARLS